MCDPHDPHHSHGGAYMAFADTLGATGAVMNLQPGTGTTTLESKTNFLGGAPVGTTIEQARTKGFVETMFGRRRMVPELNSRNGQIRQGAERTGTGFDVHAFGPGDHVWLGGVRVPHGRGVQAGVVALDGAAVERLVLLGPPAQLEDDRVLVPLAVAVDLVGVEARPVQRAVPASEQPRLQRRERRPAQLVPPLRHRRPVQVDVLALGLFSSAMIVCFVQRGRRVAAVSVGVVRATTLLDLHHTGSTLVLPNVWDAWSARADKASVSGVM